MGTTDKILGSVVQGASEREKNEKIEQLLEKFLADMTIKDKQKMMAGMPSRMMECCMERMAPKR